MTYNEAVYEWFVKPMSLYIKTNPKELIEYLNNHQKKVCIMPLLPYLVLLENCFWYLIFAIIGQGRVVDVPKG